MPLPCPQVFHDIFAEYDFARLPDRKSALGIVKSSVERITGIYTGKETTIEQIETIKNDINAELTLIELKKDPKDQFVAWFKLIFTLGQKAEIAQHLKYPNPFASKDNPSLFCETLHALRSYIIYKLRSKNDDFKKMYDDSVTFMTVKAIQLENEIIKDSADDTNSLIENLENFYQSKDPTFLEIKRLIKQATEQAKDMKNSCIDELYKMTVDLSFLQVRYFVIKARLYKQLDYLQVYNRKTLILDKKVPANAVDEMVPYCLHKGFHEILYEACFRDHTKKSFADFEKEAEGTYTVQKRKEAERLKEKNDSSEEKLLLDNDFVTFEELSSSYGTFVGQTHDELGLEAPKESHSKKSQTSKGGLFAKAAREEQVKPQETKQTLNESPKRPNESPKRISPG